MFHYNVKLYNANQSILDKILKMCSLDIIFNEYKIKFKKNSFAFCMNYVFTIISHLNQCKNC